MPWELIIKPSSLVLVSPAAAAPEGSLLAVNYFVRGAEDVLTVAAVAAGTRYIVVGTRNKAEPEIEPGVDPARLWVAVVVPARRGHRQLLLLAIAVAAAASTIGPFAFGCRW